jgi:hypothetical protein
MNTPSKTDKKSATFSDFMTVKATAQSANLPSDQTATELDRNGSEYRRGKGRSLSYRHFPTAKQEWDRKEYSKSLTHNHYYPPVRSSMDLLHCFASFYFVLFVPLRFGFRFRSSHAVGRGRA